MYEIRVKKHRTEKYYTIKYKEFHTFLDSLLTFISDKEYDVISAVGKLDGKIKLWNYKY